MSKRTRCSATPAFTSPPQLAPQVNCGRSGLAEELGFAQLRKHFQNENASGKKLTREYNNRLAYFVKCRVRTIHTMLIGSNRANFTVPYSLP